MEEPLISVIIPVYNQQKELLLALESIKNQTYKNIEVIVEEDKLHEGAPAMRNRGLAKAGGKYVIFWDADIVAEPEMLKKMCQTLQKNPQASYAYCNFQFSIFNFQKNIKSQIFNIQKLQKNNYIHTTSLIWCNDVVKWDESLKRFQDWDLWLTMAEQGKTGVWIDEYLFTIISRGTMSRWLPSFAYKKPWKWFPGIRGRVKKYEEGRRVVIKKHGG